MNLKQVGICLGVGLLAFQANAAEPLVEPGLWEMTMDMSGQHAEQLKQLEKEMQGMSEQERQMMASMMGSAGMNIMKPNVIRTCITKEEAATPSSHSDDLDDCQQSIKSKSASKLHLAFTCPDSSGEAIITYDGNKSYSVNMTGTSDGETFNQTIKARWVQANCQ